MAATTTNDALQSAADALVALLEGNETGHDLHAINSEFHLKARAQLENELNEIGLTTAS